MVEHERYGKHSVPDNGDRSLVRPSRDMSSANWIPVDLPANTAKRELATCHTLNPK